MLIIEPCAGLSNRILALATAYRLAKKTKHGVKLLWDVDGAVGAKAGELFCLPPDIQIVTLTKSPAREKPLLWLKSRMLRTMYRRQCDVFLDCGDIEEGRQGRKPLDLAKVLEDHGTVYIKAFCELEEIGNPDIFSIFRPSPAILKKGRVVFSRIGSGTTGMHIRRTDHADAIAHSPAELFYEKAGEILSAGPEGNLFLATDDPAVEQEMKGRFPGKIITCERKEFSRKSKDGMQDSVIDLLALSRCIKIYGSYGSTFSRMASYIGGCELEILEVQSE